MVLTDAKLQDLTAIVSFSLLRVTVSIHRSKTLETIVSIGVVLRRAINTVRTTTGILVEEPTGATALATTVGLCAQY